MSGYYSQQFPVPLLPIPFAYLSRQSLALRLNYLFPTSGYRQYRRYPEEPKRAKLKSASTAAHQISAPTLASSPVVGCDDSPSQDQFDGPRSPRSQRNDSLVFCLLNFCSSHYGSDAPGGLGGLSPATGVSGARTESYLATVKLKTCTTMAAATSRASTVTRSPSRLRDMYDSWGGSTVVNNGVINNGVSWRTVAISCPLGATMRLVLVVSEAALREGCGMVAAIRSLVHKNPHSGMLRAVSAGTTTVAAQQRRRNLK
ncbi:hypothetical protein EI94DRAFT_1785793 [Lactarius quietus]|nr:hypothetical protein EI94DRAFT_1785793 [Lactarius quietus]